jgi:hypothetical protein
MTDNGIDSDIVLIGCDRLYLNNYTLQLCCGWVCRRNF